VLQITTISITKILKEEDTFQDNLNNKTPTMLTCNKIKWATVNNKHHLNKHNTIIIINTTTAIKEEATTNITTTKVTKVVITVETVECTKLLKIHTISHKVDIKVEINNINQTIITKTKPKVVIRKNNIITTMEVVRLNSTNQDKTTLKDGKLQNKAKLFLDKSINRERCRINQSNLLLQPIRHQQR